MNPSQQEVFRVAGQVLWSLVQLAGLVTGIVVAARSARLRRPALCVIIAMTLSLLARVGMLVAVRWVQDSSRTGSMSSDEVMGMFSVIQFLTMLFGVASDILLMVGVFLWRGVGSGEQSRESTTIPSAQMIDPQHATASAAPMPMISSTARITAILSCSIVGSIMMGAGVALAQNQRMFGPAIALLALGTLAIIAGSVVVVMTVHALWKSIQPPPVGRGVLGLARATPGAAVGLLFVPLFNLYWAFQALPGFATDVNKTLDARGIEGPRASRGLGIAWCVCAVVSIIPFVGIVTGLIGMVIVPLFLSSAIGAANAVRRG